MITNYSTETKIETVTEENSLYVVSGSKVIFKNHDAIVNLNQISNCRLVTNRNITTNVIQLVFSGLLLGLVLPLVESNILFQGITLTVIQLFIIVAFRKKYYSYKLLINKSGYCFNEISIDEENLHFAKLFLSKFPAFVATKNNRPAEFQLLTGT